MWKRNTQIGKFAVFDAILSGGEEGGENNIEELSVNLNEGRLFEEIREEGGE